MGGSSQGASGLVWPLVGRERELDLIAAAIDEPTCDGIRLIGSPGVGKTRLARSAAELGREKGMTPVVVRATATATEFPFAALTPLLLQLDVDIAHVDQPMFAIAHASQAAASDGHPLLLVIDDAPLLDRASLSVVDQLAGTTGTFLLLTERERTTEGGASGGEDATFDLWKDDRIRRLQVEPLESADLMTLVQVALGGPVDGGTLKSIVDACSGNLLLLRELVLGARESGLLAARLGIWRLQGSMAASPRLQSLIDHRLQGFGHDERELLELIALGEPLDARVVAAVHSIESAERLERDGLLESVAEHGSVQMRFTHPLYAEVVRAGVPATRRTRLYRTLADATENVGLGGSGDPQHDLRVAVWHLEGGNAQPEPTIAAARLALRRMDFGLAARLARASWEATGSVASGIVLADALDRFGHVDEVQSIIRQVYPQAVTDEEIAALSIRLASSYSRSPDRTSEVEAVLAEAYERVTDPSCRRLIDAQRSAYAMWRGDIERTLTLGPTLLDDKSDQAYSVASIDVALALALAGRSLEALRQLEQFAATHGNGRAARVPDTDLFTTAQVYALLEAGMVPEALRVTQSAYDAVLSVGHPDAQAWLGCFMSGVLVVQGDVASAEQHSRESVAIFQEIGHPGERWALAAVAVAVGHAGRGAEAMDAVAMMDSLPPSGWGMMDVFENRGRAWAAVAAGDLSRASSVLWDQAVAAESASQLTAMVTCLHDLVRIGRDRGAAVQLESMEGRVEGELMSARASHARALLGDDPLQAADAADRFERCGAHLFAAEAASLESVLASAAGLRRRSSDAARRATRLAMLCPGARTPALATSEDEIRLSSREREIAYMVAQGLTNRTISERLVLSKRTVENHLQRVYAKVGVSSRAQLAELLGREQSAVE